MLYKNIAHQPWLQLCVLFVLFYGLNLLSPRDFWVQDEMRYAEVVREMLESSNWLVPHLNGYPYPDKPALYFWLVAWVGKLIGHGEMSFRLVSALSTFIAGLGIYKLGNLMAGKPYGFWASIIFATCLLTMIVGQIMRMDMLLTAVCVFAWIQLLQFDRRHQAVFLIGFWLFCLLSMAIKGPIALMFNVLPAFAWFYAKRGFAGVFDLRPLLGIFSIASLVCAWIFAVYHSGQGDYLSTIWHQQLVGRTINSWSHKEPIYFYLVLLPMLLMPWSGVIFKGGWQLFRSRDAVWQSVIFFAIVPLVGISFVSGKLFIYLEPLIPALSLLAAGVLGQSWHQSKSVNPWFSWPPAIFLFALGVFIAWGLRHYLAQDVAKGIWVAVVLFMLSVISAFAIRLAPRPWFYSMVGVSIVLSWLFFTGMTGLLNPLFSARLLGESVKQQAAKDAPVAVVNATRGVLNYYAGRTFTELKKNESLKWLAQHPDGLLIIKTKDLKFSFGVVEITQHCRMSERYRIEFKEYHVLAGCTIK